MSERPLIEARRVTKFYPGEPKVAAVAGLSVTFAAGEFTAIAGPSGSGKSTLLNLLGTIDQPSEGEVLCEGRVVSRLSPDEAAEFRLRKLGFIFQAYNLIPVLTARENVEYPLELQGVPRAERRARALEALSRVGLAAFADRRPNSLSGGQQQRVAVARAIVHRPAVVLAYEPTANLDSKTGAALLDLMVELNRDAGVTFLFSSHDPAVLARAWRVVPMHDGRLVAPNAPAP